MADHIDLQQLFGGEIDLAGCDFRNAELTYRNLRGRNFHSAKFTGADLTGSDLSGADLMFAHLMSVTAKATKFDNAKIGSAILSSDLSGASFRGALNGSNIQKVNFSGADLRGASFAETTIDEDVIFDSVLVDSSTDFSHAQVSRATARKPIFANYNYVNGRLIKRIDDSPNDVKPSQPDTLRTSASVITQLNSQSQAIADMAAALAASVEQEITRLQAVKPNDEMQLLAWQDNLDFLSRLATGLRDLHGSVLQAQATNKPAPDRFREAVKIVVRLRDELKEWITAHTEEVVDSTSRVALIGLGTGFLGLCGAPVAGAFAVTAALLGGPKVGNIVAGAIKDAKS